MTISTFYILIYLQIFAGAYENHTPSVAVIPPSCHGVDTIIAAQIADVLSDQIMKTGKARVMERSQMRSILKEQEFQQSGACDGSECAVEIGKLLSIDRIVIGNIGKLGESYTISMKLVDVGTGEIIVSSTKMRRGEIDDFVSIVLPEIAKELVQIHDQKSENQKYIEVYPERQNPLKLAEPTIVQNSIEDNNTDSTFEYGIMYAINGFSIFGSDLADEQKIGGGLQLGATATHYFDSIWGIRATLNYLFEFWNMDYPIVTHNSFLGVTTSEETETQSLQKITTHAIEINIDALYSIKQYTNSRLNIIGGLGAIQAIKSSMEASDGGPAGSTFTENSIFVLADIGADFQIKNKTHFFFKFKRSITPYRMTLWGSDQTPGVYFNRLEAGLIHNFNPIR